jgi:hypothetical protein
MDHKLWCKNTRLQSSSVCADGRRSSRFSSVSEVAAKTMQTALLMAFCLKPFAIRPLLLTLVGDLFSTFSLKKIGNFLEIYGLNLTTFSIFGDNS